MPSSGQKGFCRLVSVTLFPSRTSSTVRSFFGICTGDDEQPARHESLLFTYRALNAARMIEHHVSRRVRMPTLVVANPFSPLNPQVTKMMEQFNKGYYGFMPSEV